MGKQSDEIVKGCAICEGVGGGRRIVIESAMGDFCRCFDGFLRGLKMTYCEGRCKGRAGSKGAGEMGGRGEEVKG
jgi:hypothetical protein